MKKVDRETISKKRFIEKLANKTDVDAEVCKAVFMGTLDLIVDELRAGNKLEFRGTFVLGSKIQEQRFAQNPKTLEKVSIPRRRVVYFKKGDRIHDLDGGRF